MAYKIEDDLMASFNQYRGLLERLDVGVFPAMGTMTIPGVKKATAIDLPEDLKNVLRPNGEPYIPRAVKIGSLESYDIAIARKARESLMAMLLYGEPGCGKTAMIEAAFGEELQTIQGSGETEVADFVGSWTQQSDGTYTWVDGPLPQAMEAGHALLIDEIALIDPRVMAVVYGVMDGRGELVVTANPERGVVKAADGFYVVGACNPHAPGAMMSEALLSRFAIHIEIAMDWDLVTRLKIPPKIVHAARNLHHKMRTGEVVSAPQVRELITFRDIEGQFGTEFAIANIVSQAREEDRATYIEILEAEYAVKTKALAFGHTKKEK